MLNCYIIACKTILFLTSIFYFANILLILSDCAAMSFNDWRFGTPIENTVFTTNIFKVSKGAKIRNRYNQVPHLTQDTNGKVTNSK